LAAIPEQTTLHIRPSLLSGVIARVKAEWEQERQHFSRKLKWDPSDFSSEKFAGG
jgi:hypothetical protein